MEQRAVIRFFTLKGLKSRDIHAELMLVYGGDSLASATVKKWNKRFREGRTDLFDDSRVGCHLTHDLAEAIRSVDTERPFISCKILWRHFRIGKATCLRILHVYTCILKRCKSTRIYFAMILTECQSMKSQPNAMI
jgi:hypothetical protein